MIYTNDFFALGSVYPNDALVQLVDSFTNENVNFKKVTVGIDGTIITPSNESHLIDGIIYRKKGNEYYADVEWLINRTVYVKRFGAKGDGVTNDAPAIRRMISFLPQSNFFVVFENAKYMQGDGSFTERYALGPNPTTGVLEYIGGENGEGNIGPELFFSFTDKSDFTIYGNGAVVKAHPKNPPITNMRGFEFIQCKNFKVENLNYDGSKNDRKPDGRDPNKYNNQSGFKVSSSQRYELLDCRSDNCCMDGFFISSDDINANNWNEDGILRNCHADNNYRQGSSIVSSKRFKVIGGSYTNTGRTYGTLPEAGIDIEEGFSSDFGRGSIDTVVDGALFENNSKIGLSLHFGTRGANVVNCVFKNDGIFVAPDGDGLSCNNTIYNNNFYDSTIRLSGGGEHFYGNRIYLSPSYPFQFILDNQYHHFVNKKCRETLVYDNYIYREAGNSAISGGVTGALNIGNVKNGVRVFKNIFINIASTGNFLFIHGPADRELEFYDNTFNNTPEFITNTSMQSGSIYYTNYEDFFKKAYNNKIEIPDMDPMVFTAHRSDGDKFVKTFKLKRIPKGKYVDISFDKLKSDFDAQSLYLKVTTKGYWFQADSTQVKEEIISILDVKPISYTGTLDDFKKLPVSTGLYTKNNKTTFTLAQSSADAAVNQLWNLDVTIELLGNYTDDFPIVISEPYDVNTQPMIINLPIVKSINQANSSATDITTLRNDFNNLLLKLKNAGVMQS